jgi:hypothetical protein
MEIRTLNTEDSIGVSPSLSKKFEKSIRGAIANGVNPYIIFDMTGFESFTVQFWNNTGNPLISFETSNDGKFWSPLHVVARQLTGSSSTAIRTSNNQPFAYSDNKSLRYVRVGQTTIQALTKVDILLSQQNVSELNNSNYALENNLTSSINVTTTGANVVFPANSPTFINSLSSFQIANAGATGTIFQFKSGSTILYQNHIGANSQLAVSLYSVIVAGTSTALSFEILNTSGSNIYLSAQGKLLSNNQ